MNMLIGISSCTAHLLITLVTWIGSLALGGGVGYPMASKLNAPPDRGYVELSPCSRIDSVAYFAIHPHRGCLVALSPHSIGERNLHHWLSFHSRSV